MLMLLTILCTACGAFTFTLWLTGYAGGSAAAVARLGRLNGDQALPAAGPSGPGLRQRSNVRLAGINIVSGDIAAKWGIQLERAGLTLNAREYFMLRLTVGSALSFVAYIFSPIPILALAGLPLGFILVGTWLKRRINTRLHKMEAQLVELLQMLASGLRAGFGLVQALETSIDQMLPPLSVEIRRTLRDTAMGASIDQSLTSLNERVGSADFDIVITAILIQRSVGGNLAEILDNVAHTMRERERIRGEIRTLTSQQRMTGFVIGGIPVGLALFFLLIAPSFITPLFTEKVGQMMLGAAVILETLGFLVIRKIVNIEV